MPKYAINLNNLNIHNIKKICATDSRLRPDIRAFEFGDWKLAAEEYERIEDKQRSVVI